MNLALESFNNLPRVTRWLAISFFAGWLLELAFGAELNFYFGLVPRLIIGRYWLWQPVTYIFIHAGFWHFIFNAFMLWMLGRFLEPEMGAARFLRFFLFCGLAAGFFTAFVSPRSAIPVIGASGAVYGLLAAFAFYYPDMKVYLYFIFPLTARQLVIALAALEFTLSLAVSGSKIANITHLSGLVFGWLYLKAGNGSGEWRVASGEGFGIRNFFGKLSRQTAGGSASVADSARGPRQASVTGGKLAALDHFSETDALLEKISKNGIGSLSKSELEKLNRRSRGGNA